MARRHTDRSGKGWIDNSNGFQARDLEAGAERRRQRLIDERDARDSERDARDRQRKAIQKGLGRSPSSPAASKDARIRALEDENANLRRAIERLMAQIHHLERELVLSGQRYDELFAEYKDIIADSRDINAERDAALQELEALRGKVEFNNSRIRELEGGLRKAEELARHAKHAESVSEADKQRLDEIIINLRLAIEQGKNNNRDLAEQLRAANERAATAERRASDIEGYNRGLLRDLEAEKRKAAQLEERIGQQDGELQRQAETIAQKDAEIRRQYEIIARQKRELIEARARRGDDERNIAGLRIELEQKGTKLQEKEQELAVLLIRFRELEVASQDAATELARRDAEIDTLKGREREINLILVALWEQLGGVGEPNLRKLEELARGNSEELARIIAELERVSVILARTKGERARLAAQNASLAEELQRLGEQHASNIEALRKQYAEHLGSLQRDLEAARRQIQEVTGELGVAKDQASFYRRQLGEKQREYDGIIAELRARSSEQEATIAALQIKLAQIRDSGSPTQAREIEALKLTIEQHLRIIHEHEHRIILIGQERDEYKQRAEDAEAEVERLRAAALGLNDRIQELEAANARLTEDNAAKEILIADLRRGLGQAQNETGELRAALVRAIAEGHGRVVDLTGRLEEEVARNAELTAELEAANQALMAERDTSEGLRGRVAELEAASEAQRARIAELEAALDVSGREESVRNADLRRQLETALARVGVLEGQLQEAATTIARLEALSAEERARHTEVEDALQLWVDELQGDLESRVGELEQAALDIADRDRQLREQAAEIARLKRIETNLRRRVRERELTIGENNRAIRELRERITAMEQDHARQMAALQQDRDGVVAQRDQLAIDLEQARGTIAVLTAERDALQRTIGERDATIVDLRANVVELEEAARGYVAQIEAKDRELAQLRRENGILKRELQEARDTNAALTRDKDELQAASLQRVRKLDLENARLRDAVARLTGELDEAVRARGEVAEAIRNLEEILAARDARVQELERELSTLGQADRDKAIRIQELEGNLADSLVEVEDLTARLREATRVLEERDRLIADLRDQLEQARRADELARAEINRLAEALRDEQAGRADDAARLQAEIDRLRADNEAIALERDVARGEIVGVRGERDAMQAERDAMRVERDALRAELLAARADAVRFQAERDAALVAPENAANFEALRAFMRQVAAPQNAQGVLKKPALRQECERLQKLGLF